MRTRGLAVLVLTGLLWAVALPALGAGSLEAHGWWWRVAGLSGLPSPPWVPEDGLAVARDVEGPSAIAAVRYEVGEDVSMATLTLEVANEQGGQTAAIRACPARARWRAADPGDWQHRPGADCEAGEVRGERDEEGETWTFDVGLLVDDGTLNIVLLPADAEEAPEAAPPGAETSTADEGGDGPPFQVAFEPPTDDSLEASEGFGFGDDATGGGATGGDFDSDGFEADETPEPETGSGEPQQAGPPDFGADSSAPLSSPQGGGQSQPGGEPSQAAAPQVADDSDEPAEESDEDIVLMPPETAEQQPQAQDAAMAPVAFGQDRARQAAAAVALMTAIAAAMLWLSPGGAAGLHGLRQSLVVRPEVATALGTAAAGSEGVRGGLGRFIKSREGDPPPL
jgi:hypothetical protein